MGSAPGRRRAFTAPRLCAIDVGLLAVVALVLVPGARLFAAWPAIWFVPGWFLARHVLSVRGFALAPLAVGLSVAVTTFVCLPATILMGRPSPAGIAGSIAVFALVCACSRGRAAIPIPPTPAPPAAFTATLAAFVVLRVACACRAIAPDLSTPDGAYFVGMVRSLASSFPPACPEAAGHRLVQPWGYWFAYAASHVASGADVAVTLGLSSAVVAVAFASALYLAGTWLTGDRLAGALTLPLALGGGGARWIVDSIAARAPVVDRLGWGGVTSSGENVWDGFYDVPALTVLTLTLLFASLALRERSARLAVVALGLAVVLPFHHPAYFVVGGAAAVGALLFEVGRGRASWVALAAVVVAPAPFYLLFVHLYAKGSVPSQAPFFTDVLSPSYYAGRCADRLRGVLGDAGLWLPFAAWGAWRGAIRPRAFFAGLLAASFALAVFTENAAHNGHWTLDPLAVAAIVLAAAACAQTIRAWPRAGVAVTAILLALGVVSGHWERRLPERVAQIVHPAPGGSADQRELAAWLGAHSPASALVVAPAENAASIDAIEGLAGRRVYRGYSFHLRLMISDAEVGALARQDAAILADPRALAQVPTRVDYVVHVRPELEGEARAWRERERPAFENGSFVVYATP